VRAQDVPGASCTTGVVEAPRGSVLEVELKEFVERLRGFKAMRFLISFISSCKRSISSFCSANRNRTVAMKVHRK